MIGRKVSDSRCDVVLPSLFLVASTKHKYMESPHTVEGQGILRSNSCHAISSWKSQKSENLLQIDRFPLGFFVGLQPCLAHLEKQILPGRSFLGNSLVPGNWVREPI